METAVTIIIITKSDCKSSQVEEVSLSEFPSIPLGSRQQVPSVTSVVTVTTALSLHSHISARFSSTLNRAGECDHSWPAYLTDIIRALKDITQTTSRGFYRP